MMVLKKIEKNEERTEVQSGSSAALLLEEFCSGLAVVVAAASSSRTSPTRLWPAPRFLAVSFNLIMCVHTGCSHACSMSVCVHACVRTRKSIVIYNSLHPSPTSLYTRTYCLFNIA